MNKRFMFLFAFSLIGNELYKQIVKSESNEPQKKKIFKVQLLFPL